MRERFLENLRNAPVGAEVSIGRYEVVQVRKYDAGAHAIPCRFCSFKVGVQGAGRCPYSSACLGVKRPDGESVIFRRIGHEEV